MNAKKILIVYFSKSGLSKKLATEISRSLKSDIEEIKTPVSYAGFFGYQRALIHAVFKRAPQIKKLKHNPADYDLVIVGGPVWGGSLSGPVRSFLINYKDNLKDIAFFLTQGGQYGKTQVFKQMQEASGKKQLANLSITDNELNDGTFLLKISAFVSELQAKKAEIFRKEVPKQTTPFSGAKLSSIQSS